MEEKNNNIEDTEDTRKDVYDILEDEGKILTRGAEMLECGESGDCCCLNRAVTPELNNYFTPRRKDFDYVVRLNKYKF